LRLFNNIASNRHYNVFDDTLFQINYLNENTLPDFITSLHKATYRLLNFEAKSTVTKKVGEIYRNAAQGAENSLNTQVLVNYGVEIVNCPNLDKNKKYIITDPKRIPIIHESNSNKVAYIDSTDGKYIIKTYISASGVDLITPHAYEQIKSSLYMADGNLVPNFIEIDIDIIGKEIIKSNPNVIFTLISPKPFKGDISQLPDKCLIICGQQLVKFFGIFADLSFVKKLIPEIKK